MVGKSGWQQSQVDRCPCIRKVSDMHSPETCLRMSRMGSHQVPYLAHSQVSDQILTQAMVLVYTQCGLEDTALRVRNKT